MDETKTGNSPELNKPIDKLILKPGVRYAYNTTYKTPVIPSLNLKWMLNDEHTIRASYARGFRAPSLKELYFLFVDRTKSATSVWWAVLYSLTTDSFFYINNDNLYYNTNSKLFANLAIVAIRSENCDFDASNSLFIDSILIWQVLAIV